MAGWGIFKKFSCHTKYNNYGYALKDISQCVLKIHDKVFILPHVCYMKFIDVVGLLKVAKHVRL